MDFQRYARSEPQLKTVSGAAYDEGLRSYMLKIYNYMALALTISGLVAYGASTSTSLMNAIYGTPLQWVVMLAPLGIVIYLSARIFHMSEQKAQAWFWIYASVMGLSLAYIFAIFTATSIARVFFISAASFGSLSLYGYTTKKDLSGFGSFLFMGLVGIVLASLVNIFLQSAGLHFAVSVLGVLIFAGLTAYDTQTIKNTYFQMGGQTATAGKLAIIGALKLYLDFLNLFLFLLQFIGDRK